MVPVTARLPAMTKTTLRVSAIGTSRYGASAKAAALTASSDARPSSRPGIGRSRGTCVPESTSSIRCSKRAPCLASSDRRAHRQDQSVNVRS